MACVVTPDSLLLADSAAASGITIIPAKSRALQSQEGSKVARPLRHRQPHLGPTDWAWVTAKSLAGTVQPCTTTAPAQATDIYQPPPLPRSPQPGPLLPESTQGGVQPSALWGACVRLQRVWIQACSELPRPKGARCRHPRVPPCTALGEMEERPGA